jgi:hypothetical protein
MAASSDNWLAECIEMPGQIMGNSQIPASVGRYQEKPRDSEAVPV